ncbi:hypothetical protein A0J61_10512 [Choanephora cucurbitarum]|uniref:SWIM-type domain-containing protein n=1 Tax=Choanephora cucurbitarum TaxID=101091 RepID=A0A1C7MYG2_9FUNG|nr:hypothetical protein A0J61_10512 [Choanephora cucurbitarum]
MIFKELLKLRSAVTPVTYCVCLCSIRLQYDLPCKHILSINGNQIPLDTIASRWRFDSIKNDNADFEGEKEEKEEEKEEEKDCTVIDATGNDYKVIRSADKTPKAVTKSTENASIPALASDLIDFHNSLSTKQDRENLIDSIQNGMKRIESKRIESVCLLEQTLMSKDGQKIYINDLLTFLLARAKTSRKRTAPDVSYGTDDFVNDKSFRANKRARGSITQAINSVMSNAINRSDIVGYLDPKGDENCGFRAVAFLVDSNGTRYEDEDQYLCVRSKMLKTLEKYKHLKGLNKTDIAGWFYGPDYAQLVADTYNIPAYLYPSSEAEYSSINPALIFLPLNLPKTKSKPVAIHIRNSLNLHWYAIKLGVNQTNLPTVYHHYFNIDGKLEEYESYWNKWHQFQKQSKSDTRPETITIE